jgi:hypothetical protein
MHLTCGSPTGEMRFKGRWFLELFALYYWSKGRAWSLKNISFHFVLACSWFYILLKGREVIQEI